MTIDSRAPWKDRIIFEDEACVVINKLSGESSEDIAPPDSAGGKPFFPVHRLDMPVSGCLLLAKTPEAAAFLGEAFARRSGIVLKNYWAIVEIPENDNALPNEAELSHWLYEDRKRNKSFAAPLPDSDGKERRPGRNGSRPQKALLRYRLAGKGEHYLFLEIELVTGRHHQIRAQLAAIGLHIKGDLKYGARRSEKNGGIRLHACSLVFPDLLNRGGRIEAKALPPEMDTLWDAFAKMSKMTHCE